MTLQIEQIQKLTGEAVLQVFKGMLSMDLAPESPSALPPDPEGEIIGSVGFIGEVNGVICLYAGVSFAKVMTSRMLGLAESEVDGGDMVNDAVGELSNMVVGYVKSRLCDAGSPCTMTIPSIVRGQQLSVEGPTDITRRILSFRHGNYHLVAELLLKQPQS